MTIQLYKKLLFLRAFSLIEVVLAMGVFLITVLALVGLMGPALKSVGTVTTTDEVASVVDSVNAFLNSSPHIGTAASGGNPEVSRFDAIYGAVQNDGHATVFVCRWYDDTNSIVRQEIGFEDDQGGSVNSSSVSSSATLFGKATGPIYRVVLTASSAMLTDPDTIVSTNPTGNYSYYTLTNNATAYKSKNKNYLALEVRIFAEEPGATPPTTNLDTLANETPLLVYNTAILRD